MWSCVSLILGLAGPAPRFPIELIAESLNLRSPPVVMAAIALTDGKFGAYMQVHIQNDGPVTMELESPAPGAVASDPEHLSKLEKQQQRTEKARAKGPSGSSKKRSAPCKEDHKAGSGAEGDMSSEREPVGGPGAVHYH